MFLYAYQKHSSSPTPSQLDLPSPTPDTSATEDITKSTPIPTPSPSPLDLPSPTPDTSAKEDITQSTPTHTPDTTDLSTTTPVPDEISKLPFNDMQRIGQSTDEGLANGDSFEKMIEIYGENYTIFIEPLGHAYRYFIENEYLFVHYNYDHANDRPGNIVCRLVFSIYPTHGDMYEVND